MSKPRIKPAYIVLAVTLLIIGAFVLPQLLADAPGARSVQGSVISETIAVVDTNASAVYAINLQESSDAEHEADHIFESLIGIPGVGKASLDTESLELTVFYDETVIDDELIRTSLTQAGYIAMTSADATKTEVAEDGSVQRISIGDDGTGFDPNYIAAKAGIPVEIEFAPGTECRTVVKFPALGVEENIAQGGTVTLPALEPGEYEIICSGDGYEGTLLVE